MQLKCAQPPATSAPGPGSTGEEVLRLQAENELLRDRLERLGQAALGMGATLDLGLVLQGVIDGVRSLCGARYGALITFDASGQVRDLVTSGITDEELGRLKGLPEGGGLLGYLNEVENPLRLKDIASHPRSGGFPPGHPPMKSFLGSPIRHRGERLGNLYLTEKEGGGEFTVEDEDLIVMFSGLAAQAMFSARSHRELARSRDSLETLIEISPVGIMLFDAETMELLSLNPEVRRIVRGLKVPGRSQEELLSVMELRHPDGRKIESNENPVERTRRTGETVRSEDVILHLAGGQAVATLASAAPVYSEDGRISTVVSILQDVTPLADLARARAQFLGMVSQELRAPLTSIQGAAAVALNSSPALGDAEAHQYFRIIDQNAGRMRVLINDLLDVTQIEAGTFSVSCQPEDLASLVEEARESFLGSGPRNSVEVEIPAGLPRVRADRSRMVQALGHLLSNAARCSSDWSVIRVKGSAQDGYLSVSVSDEGWGISAENLPHYFSEFSPTELGEAGYGREDLRLGLAICKGVVEAHGGRIRAESDGPGLGARITLTIPAWGHADPSADAAGTSAPGKTRILVVDDDPQTILAVRRTFPQARYEAIVAGSADDAEILARNGKPDLVLLNPDLAGTGGADLTRRIGDMGETAAVFLFNSEAEAGNLHDWAAGADDYVIKPFSPDELLARVEAVLERRRARSARAREPYLLGDLEIDFEERRVTVAGRPVRLTATEYELLYQLSVNAGRVLSHRQLLRLAWGDNHPDDSRLLRSFIKKLRRKLGDDADNPVYIFTEPRVGYRMPKARGGRSQ